MSKYRKKPVTIEAFQWGATPRPRWFYNACMDGGRVDFPPASVDGIPSHVVVVTLSGPVKVDRGDWILQGVEGELYPCKDNIFQKTYEPVEVPE